MLGLEMEMVVANRTTGASYPVKHYFRNLQQLKEKRGLACRPILLGQALVGISSAIGESGLDNAYNLLETSFAPIEQGKESGLNHLAQVVQQELKDVSHALALEDACIINASEHPDCPLDQNWYMRVRAPRPLYLEMVNHRYWRHWEGIDAKAQNSPCTSVPIQDAARILNVILALAPASIAIFANSPLEGGKITGYKENRLTLWDRMFRYPRYEGDHKLHQLPARPFVDLGDYFRWMFGTGTVARALPINPYSKYKYATTVYLDCDPSLNDFLHSQAWQGRRNDSNEIVQLEPHSAYFEYSQFANFLDARWRYHLSSLPPLHQLIAAWQRPYGLEELFAVHCDSSYIEGRAPGAGFADPQLLKEAGAEIAATVPIAQSALQLGLIQNLKMAEDLIKDWGWTRLHTLRDPARREALDNDTLRGLAEEVLEIAQGGLDKTDQVWLDYAKFVLKVRRTGADRMLELWQEWEARPRERLAAVCAERELVV